MQCLLDYCGIESSVVGDLIGAKQETVFHIGFGKKNYTPYFREAMR